MVGRSRVLGAREEERVQGCGEDQGAGWWEVESVLGGGEERGAGWWVVVIFCKQVL